MNLSIKKEFPSWEICVCHVCDKYIMGDEPKYKIMEQQNDPDGRLCIVEKYAHLPCVKPEQYKKTP